MKSNTNKLFGLLLMGFFALTSCTQEEAVNITEADVKLSTKDSSLDIVQMTIEFYEHVTDERKEFLRDYYGRKGILKRYKKCEDDPNTEVWDVLCRACKSDDDLPIKTSDCPDETATEYRAASDTDPDPSEDCDIRKRSLGVWCEIEY